MGERTATVPSAVARTWSLAIQEQFYFIWPAILGLLRKRLRLPIGSSRLRGSRGVPGGCGLVLRLGHAPRQLLPHGDEPSPAERRALTCTEVWNRIYFGSDMRRAARRLPAGDHPVLDIPRSGSARAPESGVGCSRSSVVLSSGKPS
jgi:hypothetical protein